MPQRPSWPLTFNIRIKCPSPRALPGCVTIVLLPSFGVGSASIASPNARRALTSHLANAPIVVAAIDLETGNEELNQSLAVAVRRILATESNSRLACVNVHWARSIPIAPERITYHVLESTDPAGQLIDYARHNRVDHIVIGSRGSSMVRRYLGSVSARVVAEAPCTVSRPREEADAGAGRAAAQRA
jgi:eukaryotic-like serine/threonine-protein kinase